MNGTLELAQNKLIGSIGKLCDSFGLNKFVAQLYTVLYLSDRPLSLDEIVEKLRVSKGNVSINIRELENWGAVRSVWVKGSRKDYYEAELDIKKIFSNKLKTGIRKRIAEVSDMIDEFNSLMQSAEAKTTEEEKKIIVIYRNRVAKIEELKTLANTALTLAEKLL